MNTQARIEALQAELDKLKAELAKPEPDFDWSQMIGRLVMVRDFESQDWKGPCVLSSVEMQTDSLFISPESYWRFAKLYDGPTRPNWIDWSGGECPIGPNEFVIVQYRDGLLGLVVAQFISWEHRHADGDIMRYSVVKP